MLLNFLTLLATSPGPSPGRIGELEAEDRNKADMIEQEVIHLFKANQVT